MKYATKQIIELINRNLDWGKMKLPSGKTVRFSKALRTFARWGTVCAHCGSNGCEFVEEPIENSDKSRLTLINEDSIPMTADHIIPLAKGGANHIDNLQPMCEPCNTSKDDRMEKDVDVLYSLRSIKEYILTNYADDRRTAFVKDFHEVVSELGINPEDFLLRVSLGKLNEYLGYVHATFGIYIPLDVIAKVPVRYNEKQSIQATPFEED